MDDTENFVKRTIAQRITGVPGAAGQFQTLWQRLLNVEKDNFGPRQHDATADDVVEFENGVVASYSQNFMVRKSAGRRGARIYGYKGTIEFDWYTDEMKVFMHHSPRVETHRFESSALSHAGGDDILVWNFLKAAAGEAESLSPLAAGVASVNLCLAAKESSESGRFVELQAV